MVACPLKRMAGGGGLAQSTKLYGEALVALTMYKDRGWKETKSYERERE